MPYNAFSDVSEVLRALSSTDRAGALFVTVDPERDTPAVMKDYLSSFDPHYKGPPVAAHPLMRSKRPIASMQRNFQTNNGDYNMDHTALVSVHSTTRPVLTTV